MSRDQYDVEVEKQRTKQELISSILYIIMWLIFVGGCTTVEIYAGK